MIFHTYVGLPESMAMASSYNLGDFYGMMMDDTFHKWASVTSKLVDGHNWTSWNSFYGDLMVI